MEKNQYNLCLKLLKRLSDHGLLDKLILIGSWCLYMYEDYFSSPRYIPAIKTRDVDFLVPLPPKFKEKVDIHELLKDLGFVLSFTGSKGYIKLSHADLIVEFLVPERGRGSDKPYPLPQLGLNATPIRFLDFLVQHPMKVKFENMIITVPQPAAFALHKIIISQRRKKKFKADKDFEQALMIIASLVRKKEEKKLRSVFNSMSQKWQKMILANLKEFEEESIADLLCP